VVSLVAPRTQREGPERGGYQICFRPFERVARPTKPHQERSGLEHHGSRAPVAGTRAIWHILRLLQPGQEVRCYGLYTYGYDSPATGLFRERRVPGEWQELADVSKVGHLGALLFLTGDPPPLQRFA
jgi:hypothetical protein